MTRLRRVSPPGLAAVALLSAGCALASVSRREEVQWGPDCSGQLSEELPLARDAAIRSCVTETGSDIASRTDRPDLPYEFQVVNTDVVNAFAVPRRVIYMNPGLRTSCGEYRAEKHALEELPPPQAGNRVKEERG